MENINNNLTVLPTLAHWDYCAARQVEEAVAPQKRDRSTYSRPDSQYTAV